MKKLLVMMCAFAVALAAPVSAFGKSERAQARADAKQTCKELRQSAGKANFRSMYGSHGFGRCVNRETRENRREARAAQREARQNAAHECKAERAEDRDAFRETYGSNRNGKNAFGKCVSQKAQENEEELDAQNGEEDENQVNAARLCRAEKNEDADGFRENYGTNRNKRNAFGKCVSQKARELNQEDEQEEEQEEEQQEQAA